MADVDVMDDTLAPGFFKDGVAICPGCGAAGGPMHPWAGVGHSDPDGPGNEAGGMVRYGVCDACHKDPAHRKDRMLKMTFFPWDGSRRHVFASRLQILRD